MPNFLIWIDFIVLQIFNNQKYVLKKLSALGTFLAHSKHVSMDILINTLLLKKEKQNKTKNKQEKKQKRQSACN